MTVVHLLISLLLGIVAYWITEAFIGDRPRGRQIAVAVGVIVGILVYIGAISL